MSERTSEAEATVWLGEQTERKEAFGRGGLWVGRHAMDDDVLVFDPAESDADAEVITLYSLTQHRTRSFPRATVLARIEAITDQVSRARAKKEYSQRAKRRSNHEAEVAAADTARRSRQREGVLAAHRRYIEALGLEYQGHRDTGADHRPGRRTVCHGCKIVLDDFAGAVCAICSGVLCSCGTCACGAPGKRS